MSKSLTALLKVAAIEAAGNFYLRNPRIDPRLTFDVVHKELAECIDWIYLESTTTNQNTDLTVRPTPDVQELIDELTDVEQEAFIVWHNEFRLAIAEVQLSCYVEAFIKIGVRYETADKIMKKSILQHHPKTT